MSFLLGSMRSCQLEVPGILSQRLGTDPGISLNVKLELPLLQSRPIVQITAIIRVIRCTRKQIQRLDETLCLALRETRARWKRRVDRSTRGSNASERRPEQEAQGQLHGEGSHFEILRGLGFHIHHQCSESQT